MVARVVNSNFSPDLNIFLLIKDDSNAIPISSMLECLRSSPNLNEYFFFGTKYILASNSLLDSFK